MIHARTGWCDHGPVVLVVLVRRFGVRVGWGWDVDLPLRPWPAAKVWATPRGHADACVAWLGFYVGVSEVRP